MKNINQLGELAKLLKLLGDPTRLRLLQELSANEQNVTELGLELRLRQPAVSHHLSLLKNGNMVKARRNGKEVVYSLARPKLDAKSKRLVTKLLQP